MDIIICIVCVSILIGYPTLGLYLINKHGGSPAGSGCGDFMEMLLHDR